MPAQNRRLAAELRAGQQRLTAGHTQLKPGHQAELYTAEG